MTRTQFTFYESFFKAISRIRKMNDRCKAYDALCRYALYGQEPALDELSDAAAITFELVRPNIDASRRKARGGKGEGHAQDTGKITGRCREDTGKITGRCREDTGKITGRYGEDTGKITGRYEEDSGNKGEKKKEKEKENKKENEKEDECLRDPQVASVVSAYLDRFNAQASPDCLGQLADFARQLGPEVCLRAMDVARDEGKVSWSYLRGILRTRREQGVRSLADWDRVERERLEARRSGGGAARPRSPSAIGTTPGVVNTAPDRQAVEDMARMRKYLDSLKGSGGEG